MHAIKRLPVQCARLDKAVRWSSPRQPECNQANRTRSVMAEAGAAAGSDPVKGAPEMRYSGTDQVDWAEYNSRWEHLWSLGLQPGQRFDCAKSSPALEYALDKGIEVKDKRVIVPGCGRGYDLATFASRGASQALGLEISPTAAQAAQEHLATQGFGPGQADPRVSIVQGDFFTYADPAGPFDVGFDYTFGCAMHPSQRSAWAAGWARALKPGGLLLALVFPVDSNMDPNMGPPYPVTPQLYEQLLGPAGFDVIELQDVDPTLSHPNRGGREKFAVYQRRQ